MKRDRRVLVDHATLDDAGVFAFGRGEALVQSVDFFTPVVDDPYDFGQIAAANALSDIYAMGGSPLTALALLCMPDDLEPRTIMREILRGGQDKMREAGASIIGGHTVRDAELKFGYSVTGVVQRRHLLTNAGARAGDRLFLTKSLGTGVLSTALKRRMLDAGTVRRLVRSMTSLNRRASEAAVEYHANAATDVTGFGLLGHAVQLADASGVTLRLRPDRSWFFARTLDLVAQGVVPAGLANNHEFYRASVEAGGIAEDMLTALYDPQTSGGLLMAVPARRAAELAAGLRRRRIGFVEAGEVVTRGTRAVELDDRPPR